MVELVGPQPSPLSCSSVTHIPRDPSLLPFSVPVSALFSLFVQ
ncbi:hypothetical protein LEMLEM_LOCUS26276 [Lemmus lemmus]